MNSAVNLTPNNNVVTGAQAAQQATVVNDLSSVQSNMIHIDGGVSVTYQGKSFDNTFTDSKLSKIYPLTLSENSVVFQYEGTALTNTEDFILNIPLKYTFIFPKSTTPSTNPLDDLPKPFSSDINKILDQATKRYPILDLFPKVELKLGSNNQTVMGNNTSSNGDKDKEALKYKQFTESYTDKVTDYRKILAGHPIGNNLDNSSAQNGQAFYNHLNQLFNQQLIRIYYTGLSQYSTSNGKNLSSTDNFYYLTVNLCWPIPLHYLHEFFNNNVFLPINVRFRLELTLNTDSVEYTKSINFTNSKKSQKVGLPTANLLSGLNVQIDLSQLTNNEFSISYFERNIKTEYLQSFNNQLTMRPMVLIYNNITYKDLKSLGNGYYQDSFNLQEELPRFIVIEIYSNTADQTGLNFEVFPNSNYTKSRNPIIYNFPGCALAGFVLDNIKINTTNVSLKTNIGYSYPKEQNIFFADPWFFNENKYYGEMQEKPTFTDVHVFDNNIGDPTKPFHLHLNMDPTSEAQLGKTTILNGSTNASIDLKLNCIDPNFNDWGNLTVRVIKFTEYQITYDIAQQTTIVQFPISVGNNGMVAPLNIPGPSV